jgi:hypothetical protein
MNSVHLGHALVGKKQRNRIITDLELAKKIEASFRRIAGQNAVFGAIVRAQVAFNRSQYVGIVVNAE